MTQKNILLPMTRLRAACAAGLLLALAACGGGGGPQEAEAEIVSVSSNGVIEGNAGTRYLEVSVTLSKNAVRGVSLDYWTSLASSPQFGSAKSSSAHAQLPRYKTCAEEAGADYVPIAESAKQTLTIDKGLSSGVIQIPVCGDTVLEPNESFTVYWSSSAQTQLATRSITAVILNDEAAGVASTGVKSTNPPVASSGTYVSRDDNPLTNADSDGPAGLAYVKLDNTGTELPAGATSWSCLKDTVTGLVWLGGDAPSTSQLTWDGVSTAVGTVCGQTGWRLPSVGELLSLVNNASTASSSWTQQQAGRYWTNDSSTANAQAWFVDFGAGYGTASFQGKSTPAYARLVADPLTAPTTRLTTSGNVVLDNKTQLMWKRCAEGAQTGCITPSAFTWSDAINWVATVNADPGGKGEGYSDWRLPSKNELASLLTTAAGTSAYPAFDLTYFPETTYTSQTYWTSTSYVVGGAGTSGYKWYINFYDRSVGFAAPDAAPSRSIRLVRGGQ